MRSKTGWTLIELLVVIAILSLLGGLLAPTLGSARDRARLLACAGNLHKVGVGMAGYVAANGRKLPPFAFSDLVGCVPASGHWGGSSDPDDPALFGRSKNHGCEAINLWALVAGGFLEPEPLICPGADPPLRTGQASYFPRTLQFSTYCLRFPTSEALFSSAPHLMEYGRYGGTLLSVYRGSAGGQRQPYTVAAPGWKEPRMYWETVPQVRFDRRYPPPSAWSADAYDVATGAMCADTFWWQGRRAPAPGAAGADGYPVEAGWCHARQFNVLYGAGQVHAIADDGTVAANSIPPGGALADDGWHWATYAERIWQLFDRPKL